MRSPLLGLVLLLSGCVDGDGGLLIGTTTTVQDTGLLDRLLAAFEKDTGIEARAAVGGTGETIERGRLGDVDVLFTHSPARERSLLADGTASARHPVMWGRFLIAGPPDDPAGIKQAPSPADAFARIAANRSTFVSRADGSGTHDKELAVWSAAGLDPASFHHAWYKETGTGQGTTLLVAAEFDAYILIDEATLLQFHDRSKARQVVPLVSSDPGLRNQYAVTVLETARAGGDSEARGFAQWVTSPAGQTFIGAYGIAGAQVFFPNADDGDA